MLIEGGTVVPTVEAGGDGERTIDAGCVHLRAELRGGTVGRRAIPGIGIGQRVAVGVLEEDVGVGVDDPRPARARLRLRYPAAAREDKSAAHRLPLTPIVLRARR